MLVAVGEAGFMDSHIFCQQLDAGESAELRGVARFIPAIHTLGVESVPCSRSCGWDSGNRGRILSLNPRAGFR